MQHFSSVTDPIVRDIPVISATRSGNGEASQCSPSGPGKQPGSPPSLPPPLPAPPCPALLAARVTDSNPGIEPAPVRETVRGFRPMGRDGARTQDAHPHAPTQEMMGLTNTGGFGGVDITESFRLVTDGKLGAREGTELSQVSQSWERSQGPIPGLCLQPHHASTQRRGGRLGLDAFPPGAAGLRWTGWGWEPFQTRGAGSLAQGRLAEGG